METGIQRCRARPLAVSSGGSFYTSSLCQTGLSDFTFTFHFHALEKEMATHFNPGDGGSLVGCRLWGHTESDMTEET